MIPLQRPSPNAHPLYAGNIAIIVREDGLLTNDRVSHDDGPGWQILYGHRGLYSAASVYGVYRTLAEADGAIDHAKSAADSYGDANDLLHPVPWGGVALRLVHDGNGVMTLCPEDRETYNIMARRPVFFANLLESLPKNQMITSSHMRGIAAIIVNKVRNKWSIDCNVEVEVDQTIHNRYARGTRI